MRVLGFFGALVVGFVLWGVSLALSDGVAPFGKTGSNEVVVFLIPIVAFALPLAVIAFAREYVIAGTWILAIAPVFGFLDFPLAASTMAGEPGDWDRALSTSTVLTLIAVWLFLLGSILAAVRVLKGSGASAEGSSDA